MSSSSKDARRLRTLLPAEGLDEEESWGSGSEDEPLRNILESPGRSSNERWHPMVYGHRAITAGLPAVAGLLVMGAILVTFSRNVSEPAGPTPPVPAALGLSEVELPDPCSGANRIKFDTVISSNLGRHGPDKHKEEGVRYSATLMGPDYKDTKKVEIVLHAEGHYSPDWPKENGLEPHSNIGRFNLRPGTNASFTIDVFDPTANEFFHMQEPAITFFDLDTGANGTNAVEFLSIGGFKEAFVVEGTEIKMEEFGEGTWKFGATKEGNGTDNPTSSMTLTPLQKKRAVTLVYKEDASMAFTIFASPGKTVRVYAFELSPAVVCAYTKHRNGSITNASDADPRPMRMFGNTMDNEKSPLYRDVPGNQHYCCFIKLGGLRAMCALKDERSWYNFFC